MRRHTPVDLWDVIGRLGLVVLTRRSPLQLIRASYPTSRPTPAQLRARDDWRTVDAAWQSLDADKRHSWNTWKSYMRCSGYNRYMKVNYPRYRAGLPLLHDPPDYPPWV